MLDRSYALGAAAPCRVEHLIVDEYQDINYGQAAAARTAGRGACRCNGRRRCDQDHLRVARGTAPPTHLRDFKERFTHKTSGVHVIPLLPLRAGDCAVCLQHHLPQPRAVEEAPIAHWSDKAAAIHVVAQPQAAETDRELAAESPPTPARAAVSRCRSGFWCAPMRTLNGLEEAFLAQRIPIGLWARAVLSPAGEPGAA
jgi:hypothetical protein